MSHLSSAVLTDNIVIRKCNTATNTTLTNTFTVATVTTITGDLRITRASGSFVTDGVEVGFRITGTGIQPGTRVVGVSALEVVLSKPATTSAANTMTFYEIGFIEAGWTVGMCVQGAGITDAAATTVIASIQSETSLTLGTATTATASNVTVTGRSHVKAAVAVKTRAVPCLLAKSVFFMAISADADAPGATTAYEYSMDDGVTWRAASATFFSTQNDIVSTSLVGGRAMVVTPRNSGSGADNNDSGIPATHMRLSLVGHATNEISSVTVTAIVNP